MSASLAAYVPVPIPVPAKRVDVTARRVPETEPPYDDDAAPLPRRAAGRSYLLGPLPDPDPGGALRLVPSLLDPGGPPVRTPRDDLEDPGPRATMLARAVLETLSGDRPVGQLVRWTTPDVYDVLEPLAAARRQRPGKATLRRVLCTEPAPGVAEVTAIIQRGPRTGALALRLEGVDGRWLVTALQLG
jgi:hypothetical protein